MELVDFSREQLIDYVDCQLQHFFPDKRRGERTLLAQHMDETLARLNHCINAVRMWTPNQFYYLHSEQYTTFLYFLANTLWRHTQQEALCNKLFFLNKSLNGFNCFYSIALPDIFFIGHSLGIVLANTQFGNYLVLYQNVTVGKNHGAAPTIGEGVIFYPHSAVIGGCRIADHTVLAQGTRVMGRDTTGQCLVFPGAAGEVLEKPLRRPILNDIFRLTN